MTGGICFFRGQRPNREIEGAIFLEAQVKGIEIRTDPHLLSVFVKQGIALQQITHQLRMLIQKQF
jgi:hypothetical protein